MHLHKLKAGTKQTPLFARRTPFVARYTAPHDKMSFPIKPHTKTAERVHSQPWGVESEDKKNKNKKRTNLPYLSLFSRRKQHNPPRVAQGPSTLLLRDKKGLQQQITTTQPYHATLPNYPLSNKPPWHYHYML